MDLFALPADWLDEEFRSDDIAVLAGSRRHTTTQPLSEDGSDDAQLGPFFQHYTNDAVYLTREEEEQQRLHSGSRQYTH